jgi:hypothetical protein
MHVAPSVVMSIVLALCFTYWCRLVCMSSVFVRIVMFSSLDAYVHSTQLSLVSVVLITYTTLWCRQ